MCDCGPRPRKSRGCTLKCLLTALKKGTVWQSQKPYRIFCIYIPNFNIVRRTFSVPDDVQHERSGGVLRVGVRDCERAGVLKREHQRSSH